MDEHYKIGRNRYKPDGYFIYKIEDAIINKAKNFSFIAPVAGSIILFCSRLGGSEVAKFLSYDKITDEVCLQFMDDKTSFKFNVSGTEVFIQWEEATGEDPIVLDYYANKELVFTKTVLASTKENITQLNTLKEMYLKNKNPNLLKELNSSIEIMRTVISELINISENIEEKK